MNRKRISRIWAFLLRKNGDEEAREWHRLEDKLAKLTKKVEQRNEQVKASARCQAKAGSGDCRSGWRVTS